MNWQGIIDQLNTINYSQYKSDYIFTVDHMVDIMLDHVATTIYKYYKVI